MTTEQTMPIDHPLNPLPSAVIVGASRGTGAALAYRLAKAGYKIALVARRKELLEDVSSQINQLAGEQRAYVYQHDVTNFEAVPSLFREILRDLQRMDVFVYNSGVMYSVGMSEYDFEKDRSSVEVNLLGGMAWLGQAAVLFERMGSGHLVGISSVAGDRGRVTNPPLHASKAGLSAYLESLRNRLTRSGVHVLTVKPGYVKTDMLGEMKTPFPASTPEQVAEAVYKAIRRRKQVLYTPWWWRWIMLVIQHLPSFIFRRMSF
jgi:short-subunit dehydrogenase